MSINSPGYHSDETDQCPGPINLSDFGYQRRKSSEISPCHRTNNLLTISVDQRNSRTIVSNKDNLEEENEEEEEEEVKKTTMMKVARHEMPLIKNFYHGLPSEEEIKKRIKAKPY